MLIFNVMKNYKNLLKNFSIPFLISFLFIFTIEFAYRYLRKNNFRFITYDDSKLSFKETAYDFKYSKKEISEMIKSKGFVEDITYRPWVQIGNNDHNNKYSIVNRGIRASAKTSLKCKDPKLIWFFGGSTTYGSGVKWMDTIPSKFIQEADKRGLCYEVINYGTPYHFSFQESNYFVNNLAIPRKIKPSFVIFIDGLNDFLQIKSSIKNEPFFTNNLKEIYEKNNTVWYKKKLNQPIIKINLSFIDYLLLKIAPPKIPSNYDLPNNLNIKDAAIQISENIKNNNQFLDKLCSIYEIQCFRFIQPVPAIYNPRNFNEKISGLNQPIYKELFSVGYKNIFNNEKQFNFESLKIVDISKIFLLYDGIPYVDPWHYSPRANSLISGEILNQITKSLLK